MSQHPIDTGRREFVKHTVVGSGFALAVLPIGAETIRTPSEGLDVGEVTIKVGDFQMPAYRAMPQGAKHPPVVLVVSEIFGVHEHIADIARRFARLGYMAIAPELFVRQGDAGSYGEIAKLMDEVVNQVPDAQVMGDLDATVAWASEQGGDTSRLGVTGFCWGGRITWLYAAHNPAVKAGVAWYGKLARTPATPPESLQPRQPVDLADALKAPVLGLYGGQDPSIPLDTVDKMKSALAQGSAAARRSAFHIYPDAPHAFNADYRTSYRKDAADDGWKRCIDWFKTNGAA